jgi:inorganic pyrophosphatase
MASAITLRNGQLRIDAIKVGENAPEDVNVIIEVPVGGEPIKYEMDKASGALVVDRYLYTSMRYPGNYGFVPHTLSDDGDPIDVLVASTRAITPGAVMNCRPIGVLMMHDEAGSDEKIIAVPSARLSRRYENVHDYSDLPQITLDQIFHFFDHYKDLEGSKWVEVDGWRDAEHAKTLIVEAIAQVARMVGCESPPGTSTDCAPAWISSSSGSKTVSPTWWVSRS